MKDIQKRPIEIFGYDIDDHTKVFYSALRQQYCKYIHDTCVKPRKSEPDRKVGICTLGATVAKGMDIQPVIICPQRFKVESMFEAIREYYLLDWKNVKWIPEVSIGVGGSIDYVAVEVDKKDNIKDFLCVEIQAAGTTGTPYPYVRELIEDGELSGKKYSYGINWANEFSKTMMQQAYKKGKIVETWHRKIVFVVQDLAMQYLQKATNCSALTSSNPNSPVDFCTFHLSWKEQQGWSLDFDQIMSTDIQGINLMLGGASVNEYPTEEDFINNIVRKGISDGILKRKM